MWEETTARTPRGHPFCGALTAPFTLTADNPRAMPPTVPANPAGFRGLQVSVPEPGTLIPGLLGLGAITVDRQRL